MIYTDIDKMIATAMKEQSADALRTYRLIKTEMLKAEKDGIKINAVNEAKILMKMATQREDSIKQFIDGGRPELAEGEKAELDIIKGFLPKEVSEEEIEDYTRATLTAYVTAKEEGYKLSIKDMKPVMTIVQEKYPSANGKLISKVLQSVL